MDIISQLRDSIENLNSKFDSFNETISNKITVIEENYQDLNAKIDALTVKVDQPIAELIQEE